MSKAIDAPLGIVALKEKGPWHVLAWGEDVGPEGYGYDSPLCWGFFGDTLCAPANHTTWRYLCTPAYLPPGARLCMQCEAIATTAAKKGC